jgi:hypothetical protein
VTLARAVALFVLLDTVMAVLVVDLARLLDAEDVVGLGDCNELLVRGVISTAMC